MNPYSCS